jgi:hypothetical protein
MQATEGHVLHLRARPGVTRYALEAVRRQLTELLGARLVDSAVLDDETLGLRLATASRITALAALRAGVEAVGCKHLFVDDAALPRHYPGAVMEMEAEHDRG